LNIQSLRRDFPEKKVVLIHNQSDLKLNLKGLTTYYFSGSENLKLIENSLQHPKEFRGNFWFTSIARFEALTQYIEETGESVLHIESDVIISRDFPLEKFKSLTSTIAYPVVAKNRGVASTLFISDIILAKLLVTFSLRCAFMDGNTSDMEILASLAAEHSKDVFELAFAPAKKSFFQGSANNDLIKLGKSIKHFDGLFDGNDIGVYLFGTDPRNKRGYSLLYSEIPNNYAAIRKWHFLYDKSRNFLSLQTNTGNLRIYSIHGTCKNILLFWWVTRKSMMKRRVKRQHKTQIQTFYPRIFIQMAVARTLRNKRFQEQPS
jgi:hypothetical protein